jgi:hypothetical protein
MTKARKRTASTRRGRTRRFQPIPLTGITQAEERLALKFDNLVIKPTVKDRQIKAMQPEVIVATVRGGFASSGKQLIDFQVSGITWPDTLYVPRDRQASGRPKPPESQLYSHSYTDGTGVATADVKSGGVFSYAAASTTDPPKFADAGIGIKYKPSSSLSYVRYEPDVYCSLAYRMFVDFWPQLISGQVRLGMSLIMAAWLRSPALSGSYELVRANEVIVFDSFALDAGSHIFPNIRHTLQRNFVNSLATTFLVQGGRTYVFCVIARAWVRHNVESKGAPIPNDPNKFRLYSQMVCSVPYMAVTVQQVLVP